MYCSKCGMQISDESNFCDYCGARTENNFNRTSHVRPEGNTLKGNTEKIMSKKIMTMFPGVSPIIIMGTAAVLVVVLIVLVSSSIGHNLEGRYYTNDEFLYYAITFSKDGTFSAENNWEYGTGRYKKSGNEYVLTFTGGTSKSGNPVSQAKASSTYGKFDMVAEKLSDNSLKIYLADKPEYYIETTYYAWRGKRPIFYK